MSKYRLLLLNVVLAAAVLANHWGRQIDAASVNVPGFLQSLALPYRSWRTVNETVPPDELKLIEPDAVLARSYEGPSGEEVHLLVVAGHRKRTLHTPAYCMVGDGWETLSQEAIELPLPNGKVPAMRMVLVKQGARMVSTYFFTDGDYCTPNVLRLQLTQLAKRLRSEIPVGALVRIIVPVRGTTADTEQLTADFARETVPPVLRSLRGVHLTPR